MLCIVMSMADTPEDKRKIEKLYDKYNRLMYVVAYNILGNREDAEDAVIESWERIIKNLEKINEIDCQKTKSFIVIIVERISIDVYRRKFRRHSRETVNIDDYEEFPFYAAHDSGYGNVELYDMLDRIPKKYAEVLILYYVHGFSGKEIAGILGIKQSAVLQRISRGKKMLAKEMADNE